MSCLLLEEKENKLKELIGQDWLYNHILQITGKENLIDESMLKDNTLNWAIVFLSTVLSIDGLTDEQFDKAKDKFYELKTAKKNQIYSS